MTVGKRLELFVRQRFEEKSDFAEAMGVKQSQTSQWFGSSKAPSGETLLKMAGLGVNVHWLLTGEGEMLAGAKNTAPAPLMVGFRKVAAGSPTEPPAKGQTFKEKYSVYQQEKTQVREDIESITVTILHSDGKTSVFNLSKNT